MRVIAGIAKGRRLKSVPGNVTRPILDRIKENLFNLLGTAYVRGRWWLDLFAGTGSVGIEALSRGADFCVFIDNNGEAIKIIQENITITGMEDFSEVRRDNAYNYLQRDSSLDEPFDVIFIAPPQYQSMWLKALELIDKKPEWLFSTGIVVVQIDPKEYEEVTLQNIEQYDQRKYGNTMLTFYRRLDQEE